MEVRRLAILSITSNFPSPITDGCYLSIPTENIITKPVF